MSFFTGLSSITGMRSFSFDETPVLDASFFQTIIDNVDATLSGIKIRQETPGQGLGFTYTSGNYLQPWGGDIFYSNYFDEYKNVIEGITFISSSAVPWNPPNPDGSGGTLSDEGLRRWIYLQRGYHFGTRGCAGAGVGCQNIPVSSVIARYDPKGWMIDLAGNRGITLRGGTFSWFIQPKSLEEYQKIKAPLVGTNVDSSTWANPRNKLLYYLALSDESDTIRLRNDLVYLSSNMCFNTQIQKKQTGDSESFSVNDVKILNKDLEENVKIILDLFKNRGPLVRPTNELTSNSSSTITWYARQPGNKFGLNLGGICLFNQPIGQTTDWNNSTGSSTINTWSPTGITAHQGYYLFEGWANEGLLNFIHPLFGITTESELSVNTDKDWKRIFKDIRALIWKEIFNMVFHTREARPWFVNWNSGFVDGGYTPRAIRPPDPATGLDLGEFRDDIDVWGHMNNQWLTPMCFCTLLAAFIYKYAKTNKEREAARKTYNLGTEILAAFIMRATREETIKRQNEGINYNPIGAWLEGRGYGEQSQGHVCGVLYTAMKMGDYRLWELAGNTGANWIDNQWKYYYYTNLPNNLLINSQSVSTNNVDINGWQDETTNTNQFAMLVSKTPQPGTTGSAISEHYRYFLKPYSPLSHIIAYKLLTYARGITCEKILPNWAFISQEKMMAWHSQIPVPYTQSDEYPIQVQSSYKNVTKPVIFSVWAKAHGSYEMKSHKDAGHVSVYLGDAPILIETGEIRSFFASDEFTLKYAGVMGHNTMQLGQKHPAGFAMEGEVSSYGGTTLNGYINMDIKNQYNSRGLTTTPPPCGGFKTSDLLPLIYYTYQIGNCTRGISWEYDPANKLGTVYIQDNLGISGISSGAESISQRNYYRYHTGYNKFGIAGQGISTNGYDDIGELDGRGLTFYRKNAGGTAWEIAWNTKGITLYNLDMKWVGVTMTLEGDKSLRISREIYTSNSFKDAPDKGLTAEQQKHYAINIGISGPEDEGYSMFLKTTLSCKGHNTAW